MGLNANSGAFRHLFEWFIQPEGSDNNGNPVAKIKVFDTLMGNIRTQSGSQLQALGAVLTDDIITVMTWYDPRIDNSFFIRYNNLDYEIQHVKPDELLKEMIITAKVERNG